MASGDLISVSEAARRLSVHRETVRRWIHDGRLPALRLGPKTTRIEAACVRRMLREAAVVAPTDAA